jgi:hypothetical protein
MLAWMAIMVITSWLQATTPSSVLSWNFWTPSVALHEKFGQIDKNHGYPILADNGAKFCVKENPEGLDVIVNRSKTDGGYTIVHDTAEGFKRYSNNASVVDTIGAQFDADGTYCQGNSVGGISLAASATQPPAFVPAPQHLHSANRRKSMSPETQDGQHVAKAGKYVYFFGDGKADGNGKMKDVQEQPFAVCGMDGRITSVPGADFCFGIGANLEDAERSLKYQKELRRVQR